jgi:hypothetical protein
MFALAFSGEITLALDISLALQGEVVNGVPAGMPEEI